MKKVKFVDLDGKVYSADSCAPLSHAWENDEIELETLARGNYPGKKISPHEISGIKSIGYWNSNKDQTWGLDWHRNEGIEICLLETGNLDFSISGQTYNLHPKTLTITRPWLSHKLGRPNIGPCKLYWIILDVKVRYPHQKWQWPGWIILNPKDLQDLTRFLRQNEYPVWKANQDIEDCIFKIGNIVKGYADYDTALKIQINALLYLLLDLFRKGEINLDESLIETKRTVALFLKDLEENIIENWTLETMSGHCNLGITQFTKYCRELTNLSPIGYLNMLRIKRAKDFLKSKSKMSIVEVAFQSGFSTPQYFASVFKKHCGCTPLEFRKTFQVNSFISERGKFYN